MYHVKVLKICKIKYVENHVKSLKIHEIDPRNQNFNRYSYKGCSDFLLPQNWLQ